MVDMSGNAGKSVYVDLLERNPEIKAVRLQIDQYRPFKYYSARELSEYRKKNGCPDVILIDAPRDEETKFLHQIYGVLEEINNGRLEGQFGGNKIKDSIPRKVPIIIFSNSPPVLGALSEDRWDLMGIYSYDDETEGEHDVFVQKANVSSNVHDILGGQIYWQNVTETTVQVDFDLEYESQRLLIEMQDKNIALMKRQVEIEKSLTNKHSKITPGVIKKWGPNQVALLNTAPAYVKLQARIQKKFYTKKIDE